MQQLLDNIKEKQDKLAVTMLTEYEEDFIARYEDKITYYELIRPHWAQGYTSDGIAASTMLVALTEIYKLLGVKDQTACMQKLNQLLFPQL